MGAWATTVDGVWSSVPQDRSPRHGLTLLSVQQQRQDALSLNRSFITPRQVGVFQPACIEASQDCPDGRLWDGSATLPE